MNQMGNIGGATSTTPNMGQMNNLMSMNLLNTNTP